MALTLADIFEAPTIPTLPQVASETLLLMRDPDVQMGQVAAAVEQDTRLCTRILKTVNASYYGLSRTCPSIPRALAFLGLSTVQSLVVGLSLVDVVEQAEDDFDVDAFWRGALVSAAAARILAAELEGCDRDQAFTAALVQNIGMLAMHAAIGAEYHQLTHLLRDRHDELTEKEERIFGLSHARVGGALGQRWGLPNELVAAIRKHHDPKAAAPEAPVLPRVVHMANAIAPAAWMLPSDAETHVASCLQTHPALASVNARDVALRARSDAEELAKMLGVTLREPEAEVVDEPAPVESIAEGTPETEPEQLEPAAATATTRQSGAASFDAAVNATFDRSVVAGHSMSVIIARMDGADAMRQRIGYDETAILLTEVGCRIATAVGDRVTLCSLGDQTFGVLVAGAARRTAATVAETIRRTVASRPVELDEGAYPVTVSVGAASLDVDSVSIFRNPALIIEAATRALQAAEGAGCNCVRVFRPTGAADAA